MILILILIPACSSDGARISNYSSRVGSHGPAEYPETQGSPGRRRRHNQQHAVRDLAQTSWHQVQLPRSITFIERIAPVKITVYDKTVLEEAMGHFV